MTGKWNIVVLSSMICLNHSFGQCFDDTRVTAAQENVLPCNEQPWVLEFEDNFDGKSLSSKNWIFPYQGVLAGFNFERDGSKVWYANTGSTPQLPLSNNIVVENGILKMVVKKEPVPIQGQYVVDWSKTPPVKDSSSFMYSSAWIESQQMHGYGKYEARIKIPKGKGLWPAFWLFDGTRGHRYEIDVFEFWNEFTCAGRYKKSRLSKNPHFTIHGDSINRNSSQCADDMYSCYGNWGNSKTDYSDDYHIYTLEWDYYKIIWYIDGLPVHALYRFNGKQTDCSSIIEGKEYKVNESWPFTDKMQIRFNLGVQHGNNNDPNATDDYPKAMEIDYIRFYRKAPAK